MTNTFSTLNGIFVEKYAPKLVDLIPEGAIFIKDVPFASPAQQIGNEYHQPVCLTHEHGFTYSATNQGAFSINAPIAAVHKDAKVGGAQLLMESRLDYESAARAKDSKRAFEKAMDVVVRNMMRSMSKRAELEHLYGGTGTAYAGLGVIATNPGGTTSYAFTLTAQSWATGIWAGLEGARVQIYDNDGAGGTPSTLRGSGSAVNTVSSITPSTRTVTVATDVSDTLDSVAADDFIFFYTAKGNEWSGLVEISRNTGTLFNIDAATYSLWRGNTFDCEAQQLSMQRVLEALNAPVDRGLEGKVKLMVNPHTWTDLCGDLTIDRRYDGSYSRKKGDNGFETLEFVSQTGPIEIVPHRLMKQGEACLYQTGKMKRLGAQDWTFKLPGSDDEFMYHLPSNAGVGLRSYTLQSLFTEQPASLVHFHNIANSA